VTRPATVTDPPGGGSRATLLTTYFDPNYASILTAIREIDARPDKPRSDSQG
jgi:hypothetical protein